MATPIQKARQRLAELTAEAEDVRKFIEMYTRFSDDVEPETRTERTTESGRGARARTQAIINAMEDAILQAGTPLTRGDLVSRVQDAGIELPDTDPAKYLGTIAWRNQAKFENVEGRGYWLKGRPLPPIPVFGAALDKQLGLPVPPQASPSNDDIAARLEAALRKPIGGLPPALPRPDPE